MEAWRGELMIRKVKGRWGQILGHLRLQAVDLGFDQLWGVLEVLRIDMIKPLLLEVVKWIRKERLDFERPIQRL